MARRKIFDFKNLTPREKRELDRGLKKWRRKMQSVIDAIEESILITGENLKIWIGPVPFELTPAQRRKIQESHDYREEQTKKHPLKISPLPRITSAKPL